MLRTVQHHFGNQPQTPSKTVEYLISSLFNIEYGFLQNRLNYLLKILQYIAHNAESLVKVMKRESNL